MGIRTRQRSVSRVQAMETHCPAAPGRCDSGLRTIGAADNISSKNSFAIFEIKVHPSLCCPEVGSTRPQQRGRATEPSRCHGGHTESPGPTTASTPGPFLAGLGAPLANRVEDTCIKAPATAEGTAETHGRRRRPKAHGEAGGMAAPTPRGLSLPGAHCLTGEETSTCFSIFPVLHNDYVLLL